MTTPNGDSASSIADTIAAGAPMVPLSAAPLTPSGLSGVGDSMWITSIGGTLSVLGSTDGSTWSTVKASASYAFAPASNNTVTITFTATTQRYFRLNITANTGWPAGQLSGFQVWNS